MHSPVNKVCGGFIFVRGQSGLCHVSVFLIFMYTPKNCKKPGFVEFSLITVMVLCVGVVTYIVPLIIELSNNYQERERKKEREVKICKENICIGKLVFYFTFLCQLNYQCDLTCILICVPCFVFVH